MYGRRQRCIAIESVATILLSLFVFHSTVPAEESRCGIDTSAASVEHARYLYDMQEYACALEELQVIVAGNGLSARAKCEALLLKSAISYDSLFNADAKELRETVLAWGKAAFEAYPSWNEPYDNGDKGFEILMIEARQIAADSRASEQYSLVVHASPDQSVVIIDSSLWVSHVAKTIDPGSHEIVVSHPSFGTVMDTIVVNCDTTVFYDLPAIMKARADSLRLDSIANPDRHDARTDKQMRISIPHAPSGSRITLRLDDKSQEQACFPFAKFVVKPMPSHVEFTVSFPKYRTDFTAKIDSVVFFPKTKELRLKVVGYSAVIDFGRSEWKHLSPIDAFVYMDQSGL